MLKQFLLLGLIIILTLVSYKLLTYLFKKKDSTSTSAYKIIPLSHLDSENIKSCIKPLPIDIKSGFMHFSFKHQAPNVLLKFFNHLQSVLILEIDLTVLLENGSELRIEANKPGGDTYPHLYGNQNIPFSAVKKIILLKKDEGGMWETNPLEKV